MTPAASPKKPKTERTLPFPWRGLTIQLFLVAILPLTALLLLLTFGSLSLHQRAMRSLVGERDQRAVRTAAGAMDDQVRQRVNSLKLISASAPDLRAGMLGADLLAADFDFGLAALTRDGALQVIQSGGSAAGDDLWQALAGPIRQASEALFADQGTDSLALSEFTDPLSGKRLIILLAAAPTRDAVIAGAFSTASLFERVLDEALTAGAHASYLLVDQQGQTVEEAGHILVDSNSPGHPGVAEALRGESGTAYFPAADTEHVVAYSPINSLGWALLTEEPWEMVDTPTLRLTQSAPLILVPVLLVALLALWFGARQVVRPLQQLEERSSRLAQGDFQAIAEPVGGISEIRQLQSELVNMAQKVAAAQESLHGYIGAITAAQEDERRRLARELHDDTIQALIALKQRLQIARFSLAEEQSSSPDAQALDELTVLAEETIANVRRLTRGLRPIYLEDLGLIPALEMLGQETGQAAGIPVAFNRLGAERRLDGALELAFYRMAQEALNNIVRHAQAAHAEISIEFLTAAVVLTIRDDGAGFIVPEAPAEFAHFGHYGLLGIHERAELIGAKLQIRSSPEGGTELKISLPTPAESPAQAI
jgi:signal transduction histidine kinase